MEESFAATTAVSQGLTLTRRELNLLELACEGLIDKQIAAKLQISPATVQTYWERIRTKLEATNKSHAIAKYLQMPRNQTVQLHDELVQFIEGCEEDAVFAIDHEGILRTWNTSVERIFGFSEAEWVGQHCAIFFPPGDKSGATQELSDATAASVSLNYRWHQRKDGSKFWGANLVMNLGQTNDSGTFVKIVRPKAKPEPPPA